MKQGFIDIKLKINNRLKQISECNNDLKFSSEDILRCISEYPSDNFKFLLQYIDNCYKCIGESQNRISNKEQILQDKLKVWKNLSQSLTDLETKYKISIQKNHSEISDTENHIREKEIKYNEIGSICNQLQYEIDEKQQIINKISNEITKCTSEINSAIQNEENIQKQILNLEKEKDNLEIQNKSLIDLFNQMDSLSNVFDEAYFTNINRISSILSSLTSFDSFIQNGKLMKELIESSRENIDKISKEKEKISQLSSLLEEKKASVNNLKENHSKSTESLQDLNSKLENVIIQEDQLRIEVNDLQKKFDNLSLEKKSNEAKILNLRNKLSELKDINKFKEEELEKEKNNKQIEFGNSTSSYSFQIQKLEEEIELYIKDLQSLKERKSVLNASCLHLSDKEQQLKNELEIILNNNIEFEKKKDLQLLKLEKERQLSNERIENAKLKMKYDVDLEIQKRWIQIEKEINEEFENKKLELKNKHDLAMQSLQREYNELSLSKLKNNLKDNELDLSFEFDSIPEKKAKFVRSKNISSLESTNSKNKSKSLNIGSDLVQSPIISKRNTKQERNNNSDSSKKKPIMARRLSHTQTKVSQKRKTKTKVDVFEFWDDFDF